MDRLPNPWPIESETLLAELDRIRELVLKVPLDVQNRSAWQSVLDSVWRLRADLTDTLRLQRQMQEAFATKAAKKRPKVEESSVIQLHG